MLASGDARGRAARGAGPPSPSGFPLPGPSRRGVGWKQRARTDGSRAVFPTALLLACLSPLQAGGLPSHAGGPVVARPPNLVLIVADDVGVDLVGAYAEGSAPPCTPNIDALAAQGMLFRNAWAAPLCSPSRAALLTGRYGFRTGIGTSVQPTEPGLGLAEATLPELLVGYDSTSIGKWHLAGDLGALHPNLSGFASFAGALGAAVPSYTKWDKVVDGTTLPSTKYVTRDSVDDAIAAIQGMRPPWLLKVAFHASHSPWHNPPAGLCAAPTCPSTSCGNSFPATKVPEQVKAMTEVLDAELGRFLAVLDVVDPHAYVVFLGDNGTAKLASQPPFLPEHAKGTLYEGGINVPLIVRGPGVRRAECRALVSCADLFATFAELAGVPSSAEDSVSLVPLFAQPDQALRRTVYAELFWPNHGDVSQARHERAVRDRRYKLIRRSGRPDELFDLLLDPFETTDLLPSPTPEEQRAYETLQAELDALGVG